MIDNTFYKYKLFTCYLLSSLCQTVVDNPFTSYRQLLQQYTYDNKGNYMTPEMTNRKVREIFKNNPINISLSGLNTRLIGTIIKRIPKFSLLIFNTDKNNNISIKSILYTAVFATPIVNPVRFIEKQQRLNFDKNKIERKSYDIIKECRKYNYLPLFRGMLPLMTHTFISTTLGLLYHTKLQNYIYNKHYFKNENINRLYSNLLTSIIISPIYNIFTNPFERLELIMQTNLIKNKRINLYNAIKYYYNDTKINGYKGFFRGQLYGIYKCIFSLTIFHETRILLSNILL